MKLEETFKEQYTYKCKKCHESFVYESDDIRWDENGFGYSTKLIRCKHCNCINVIKYVEDYGFSKMNTDRRLYYR